jgi:hypothetical protein
MRNIILTIATTGTLLAAGCSLDVPDLNNPGLDSLENHPTPTAVNAACTGLLIGIRNPPVGVAIAAENGYVMQLGILGREAYNFDSADPRYVGEMLAGNLNSGSPFGGQFWSGPYANMRLANIVLHAVDKLPAGAFSDEEKASITGFVDTIMAIDLLEVTVTHDANGEVVETDVDPGTLSPIESKDKAYAKIAKLLDDGFASLGSAGDHFPFPLSKGFVGFDDPENFAKFNRALRARVAAYTSDYATVKTALADSFLNDAPTSLADLNVGPFHSFSTAAGDATNLLKNNNIYVSETITDEVKAYTGNADPNTDARYARKVTDAPQTGTGKVDADHSLVADKAFTLYSTPTSPVPIIRNEELILLAAEADLLGTPPDAAAATDEINKIRTISGGLPPLAAGTATLDDIVYNRNLSLLFEGGHRWIDARRFGLGPTDVGGIPAMNQNIPLENNVRYPIPLPECNARGGGDAEPACKKGSTDN